MLPGREIVVGVDGSSSGWLALRWAATEAELRQAPLVVLHCVRVSVETAWRGGPLERPARDHTVSERDVLDRAVARIRPAHPDLTVRRTFLGDSPPFGLLSAARTAALVVVGSKGLAMAPGLLLGSTALQVTLHAECPVAVVPERGASTVGTFPGEVIVGVDGSDSSETALAFACEEADRRGVGVVAVHATGDTTVDGPAFSIEPAVAPWQAKYPYVRVRALMSQESPAKALRHAAAGAQMLIVGGRGHGGFTGLMLGSVSLAAIQRPQCPVVVVRAAADVT